MTNGRVHRNRHHHQDCQLPDRVLKVTIAYKQTEQGRVKSTAPVICKVIRCSYPVHPLRRGGVSASTIIEMRGAGSWSTGDPVMHSHTPFIPCSSAQTGRGVSIHDHRDEGAPVRPAFPSSRTATSAEARAEAAPRLKSAPPSGAGAPGTGSGWCGPAGRTWSDVHTTHLPS